MKNARYLLKNEERKYNTGILHFLSWVLFKTKQNEIMNDIQIDRRKKALIDFDFFFIKA